MLGSVPGNVLGESAAFPLWEGRVKQLPRPSWITGASSLLVQPGSPQEAACDLLLPLLPNFLPSLVLSPQEGCATPSPPGAPASQEENT